MSADDLVLELNDVEVTFETREGLLGDTKQVRAVDGVSLDIHENDVVALVGESGCGKTTLGKTAIGLQRPTAGTVAFRGQDIWAARDGRSSSIPFKEIRQALQIIHQDPGDSLNPNRRVLAILSEPLQNTQPDLSYRDRAERIHSMLSVVGMSPPDDYSSRYPHQLSGGEKQRVALIRALLMNPDLILADEAISALDVSLRVDMMDLFLELQEQFNTSFLFISHDFSNARYLTEKAGGRIGVMYLGELVELGPVTEVIENPRHPYTQALVWATPKLRPGEEMGELPLRAIDIPDPVNPPSGCRFHTRCPEAREACQPTAPDLKSIEGDEAHVAACFREYEGTHEYWSSPELTGDQPGEIASEEGTSGSADAD